MGGDARLGLYLVEGVREPLPQLGFVGGHLATALAGPAAAAMRHSCAFCAPAAGAAAVAAGGPLGTNTKKRPGFCVLPASLAASSPEPKKISPRSAPRMAEPTSCPTM